MKMLHSLIEPLESRIAPAAVVTFTDLDGDLVTVSSSKGTHDQLVTATGGVSGLDDHVLQTLDLSATADFDGATISITAAPKDGKGDGFVNVGYINAIGRVLGSVTVDGDLGVISAGNTTKNAFALQTLTVHSMGMLGTSTGAPSGLTSYISGSVKAVNVKTDLSDAYVSIFGSFNSVNSSLGALTVGGSMRAPTSTGLGSVSVAGNIGSVKIGGSVVGGAANTSGFINAGGSIGKVSIGGDVIGGSGMDSGFVIASGMGDVTVGGDVRGADTSSNSGESGTIKSAGAMGNVRIGGSVLGNADTECGSVIAFSIKNVSVGGSLVGSFGTNSGSVVASMLSIGNVTIGGDLIGSGGDYTGSVRAIDGNIGNVTVRGSLLGNSGLQSGSIMASSPTGTHGTLGMVKIGGKLSGFYGEYGGTVYAHDTIAGVTVGAGLEGGPTMAAGSIYAGTGLGAVTVHGNLSGGAGKYSGSIFSGGKLGRVDVGGDLLGSGYTTGEYSGAILALGSLTSVNVGGSLRGDAAYSSASITASEKLGPVSIHGDVTGGAGAYSANIFSVHGTSKVTIGGNLTGGSALGAGSIFSQGDAFATDVSIGGNVSGGTAESTGTIRGQFLGLVSIHGNLQGGSGLNGGAVLATMSLDKVTIGGSLRGGAASTGYIGFYGASVHPQIGSVTIGGSVSGGSGAQSGGIYSSGVEGEKVGAIKIAGDWTSGVGADAGQITVKEVGSITLGGSIDGSSSLPRTARWTGDKVGTIMIGGNLVGGAGVNSGEIDYASAGNITIAGSILGGTADFAGHIGGDVEKIVIGHDIRGADIISGAPLYAGSISGGAVGSITIGGSLIAGYDHSSGSPSSDGSIVVNSLGSLTIRGSVIGNTTLAANIEAPLSIKSINIGGRVEFGLIAVYLRGGQLGSLTVGGDWIASNVVVGLGYDTNFGDGNEAVSTIPGGNPAVSSKIGSISIAGQVLGTADPSRTFGFGAEEIGAFKVGSVAFKLAPGKHNDTFDGPALAGDAVPVGIALVNPGTMSDVRAVHVFEV